MMDFVLLKRLANADRTRAKASEIELEWGFVKAIYL